MGNEDKYKAVVKMQERLIEETGDVQDDQVDTVLDICNYFRLQQKRIGVGEYQLVELADIHNNTVFSLAFSICILDNKD